MDAIVDRRAVRHYSIEDRNSFKRYMKRGQPFTFDINWPAVGKWSPGFVSDIAGDEKVSVSMSVGEWSQPTRRQDFRLRDYIGLIERLELGGGSAEAGSVPHLKQFDMLALRPQLHDDLDWGLLPRGCRRIAFRLGTCASMTGLHSDPNNGVLAQIYGSRRIYLFAPDQKEYLYPNTKFEPATHGCDVDAAHPDYHKHPKFIAARGATAEIATGQALFIPKGWYHQAMGLETNISVNCFFFSRLEWMTTELVQYRVAKWLHDHGLYRRGDCVCHAKAS